MKHTKQCRRPLCCAFVCLSLFFLAGKVYFKDTGASEQAERISHVQEVCNRYMPMLNTEQYKKHTTVFYSAENYGLSYCKIGKIASTFWAQFFYILHHDSKSAGKILRSARESVHIWANQNIKYGTNMSSAAIKHVILSARNPYTRLYSAYIDRMYIPSTSQSVRYDDKCKSLITFEEFLQNVVKNTKEGLYDYHWSPIFYLCKPCEINPTILFKQETLKQDINYVLKHSGLQIERAKLDGVEKALNEGPLWSPFGLIEDVLEYIVPKNIFGPLNCQTWKDILIRLWDALKTQGYISNDAPFPENAYKTNKDYENPDLFRKAILEARAYFPMPKSKSDSQRRKALNFAYSGLDPEVIHGIQEVFGVDFELFGYSLNPPPWT